MLKFLEKLMIKFNKLELWLPVFLFMVIGVSFYLISIIDSATTRILIVIIMVIVITMALIVGIIQAFENIKKEFDATKEIYQKRHKTQQEEIDDKRHKIQNLEEKLKASQIHDKQKIEQQIYDIKKQIDLIYEIEKAQIALANSLQSADDRIQEYNQSAKRTGRIAVELMGLDLLIIALFWFHYENFIPLFEKLGAWALTLFSFPVIVILTIAITLLRHQKKLLDEVRHYSAEKRQIELYSGLLKASQHAAAGLNDPQKSAEYVQETFTAIRNRILSEQPHSNTAASASEKEDYGLEAIVKIIADLAAKNEAKK